MRDYPEVARTNKAKAVFTGRANMKGTCKPVNNEVPRPRRDSSVVDLIPSRWVEFEGEAPAQIAE